MATLAVRGARVAGPHGAGPAVIHVRDGRIEAVVPGAEWPAGVDRLDAGELAVLPGAVDTHVHVNEPGRTDWEGFACATRAAAAGGVTTIVDMPLNAIPPATSVAGLNAKRRAAAGICHVDVAFWGGVVPGNAAELAPLARAGVCGFKCFLAPPGVPEFAEVGESDLHEALPVLAALDLPLLVHAESPDRLRVPRGAADAYATWLDSRPAEAELEAIALLIRLAADAGARVHVVHLATARALPAIAAARAAGVAITVETCPHYLTFAAADVPAGATAFKCAPPIRDAAEREGLWRALLDGAIDLVASDHSPAPRALKHADTGDFLQAWGGIASLQLSLAAVWTGARARGATLSDLARWMAAAPAALAGLDRRKGAIAAGRDADLVFWDPDGATRLGRGTTWQSRHGLTPYGDLTLDGRVVRTFVRGELVFDADAGVAPGARGRLLSRVV